MNNRRPLFVLDTNVFIEAHRRYYALDLCPGFWKCLTHYCYENRVRSIDRVGGEIIANPNQSQGMNPNPDQLSKWAKQAPDDLFVSTAEESIINTFMEMNKWVRENEQFQPQAKEKFARVADGWVAAYAKVYNNVVVTHEVFSADVKKRVPLPNVCQQFGVKCYDTFAMLRTLEVCFVLERL